MLHCHASFEAGYLPIFDFLLLLQGASPTRGFFLRYMVPWQKGVALDRLSKCRKFWKWTYSPSMLCIPKDPGSPSLLGG